MRRESSGSVSQAARVYYGGRRSSTPELLERLIRFKTGARVAAQRDQQTRA